MSSFGQPYARAIHTLGPSIKASLSAGPCEDFTIPAVKLLSGLSTGVKHGTRLSATAISMVLWAVKIEPLSESHCTGCGARIDEVASIPTAALRGARTGWRYALPLDTAPVTSRARRGAKNAEVFSSAPMTLVCQRIGRPKPLLPVR